MALTEAFIRDCADDEELYRALSVALCRQLPSDLDGLMTHLRGLPPGLRAMASVYQLDVSLTLDDLGWHFANWHHRAHCEETLRGLRELEIPEAAEMFEQAYGIVQPYWDEIGRLLAKNFDTFTEWYLESKLKQELDPLNSRMWEFCQRTEHGLLSYWVPYARKYPAKLIQQSAG
jgi:hypothetical protein